MDPMNKMESENYELLQLLEKAAALARRPQMRRPALQGFGAVPLKEPERRATWAAGGPPEGFRPHGAPGRFGPKGFPMPPDTPHRERERVLTLLSESEGISQRKLAVILDIRPQSLSELLGKLERDGLVERRKNEEDRREILVSLTALGRERAESSERAREDAAERFLSPLSREERETLSAMLQKLIFAAEDCREI